MAYVSGYNQDVFISYAHRDNEKMNYGKGEVIAWVTEFMKELKLRMNQNADGDGGVEIWMDSIDLPGNEPVTKTLETAVCNSATMIVMLSTGYLNSNWCKKEVQDFVNSAKAQDRLFIVQLENIPLEERPKVMQDLPGYKFFDKVRGNVALSQKVAEYYSSLLDLRDDLSKKLNELKHQTSSRGDDPLRDGLKVAENPMAILLAEGTPDQSEHLKDIEVYLKEQGYKVLPEKPYRRGRKEFEEMLEQDLAEAKLFVQLLGPYGPRTDDFPTGYQGLQVEMAKAANLPVLRSYMLDTIDFNKLTDSEHRCFLQESDVMALDLEEFKSKIKKKLEDLTSMETSPSNMEESSKPVIIYVHKKDLKSTHQLVSCLKSQDLPWVIYLSNEDLEKLTIPLNPAGLVLVYGEASEGPWVREQIKTFRNVSNRKQPTSPVCALYFDPPGKRDEMLTSIPSYFMPLDSSSAEDVFQKFVGELVKVRAKLAAS